MVSTLIIKYKFDGQHQIQEEHWYAKLIDATDNAEGFIDRTELLAVREDEYHTIVLRFDTAANAQKWMDSDIRKQILGEATERNIYSRREMVHNDNQFWFALTTKKMRKWKQVIASFLAVYPLTLVIPKLIRSILDKMDISISILNGVLSSMVISFLMVYVAIPLISKILKDWLNVQET